MKLLGILFLSITVSMCAERIKLHTRSPDKTYSYNFFPLRRDLLEFNVKADKGAVAIILSNDYSVKPPYYEIVIGAHGNTFSIIRKSQDGNYLQRHETVVDKGVYQKFWVLMNNTEESISVGKSKNGPFLYLQDPNYVRMSYFGVTTGWNFEGDWDFDYDMIL